MIEVARDNDKIAGCYTKQQYISGNLMGTPYLHNFLSCMWCKCTDKIVGKEILHMQKKYCKEASQKVNSHWKWYLFLQRAS
jgi:hypothetical protein